MARKTPKGEKPNYYLRDLWDTSVAVTDDQQRDAARYVLRRQSPAAIEQTLEQLGLSAEGC